MRERELRQRGERDAKAGKPIDETYFVTVGGVHRYFNTIEAATEFANDCFEKHGVVLGIERRR